LEGEIPPEIGWLRHLQGLVISKNFGVTGHLTEGLRSLVNLKELELHDCSLSGALPDWIGEMSSLTNLALANNIMGGATIPDAFFQLTDLELLSLDGYAPAGDIALAPFGQLRNLVAFHAKDAGITGELTFDMMVDSWAYMEQLDISDNSIGGTLPTNLLEASSFVSIDLHGNRLSGTLPDGVSNSELTFLSIFDNELTGTVPTSIANLVSLADLNLGKNMIHGTLPSELGTMTTLRNLYTRSNDFEPGRLPSFLEKLTQLEELSMRENHITGSIPGFVISALTALRVLELDQNDLSGSIPEDIGLLNQLDVLMLNRNQLTGRLPYAMAMMDDLGTFAVASR
jgi:Leucine-rich repeat (LRR) protein